MKLLSFLLDQDWLKTDPIYNLLLERCLLITSMKSTLESIRIRRNLPGTCHDLHSMPILQGDYPTLTRTKKNPVLWSLTRGYIRGDHSWDRYSYRPKEIQTVSVISQANLFGLDDVPAIAKFFTRKIMGTPDFSYPR